MFRRKPENVDWEPDTRLRADRLIDDLHKIDEEMGLAVTQTFAPRNVAERRGRLDQLFATFAQRHDQARRAAEEYLAEHTAVLEDLAKEKAQVEEHLANLDKIAAGMPQFGGKDEKASNDLSLDARVQSERDHRPGKDPVPIKPIQGLPKPLSTP